uniref:CCHC-type domain-containing protein n=1 Tax=Tanacetum cinerariifolium TaxID=118510 RepID=A0A6L2KDR2_TANCI|nr:hypothetical protein [Tanacetum cinerariifolium]
MSRDGLTVGSTIRIPLLYREEYSQWVERFMNYLEEQMDEEAMTNSIKNGDQPLPRVTQVSIAGTSSTEQPPFNKTTKELWDALARHMLGYEYGEQDRKAAVLYEYETFRTTKGELLLDTYIRYLQVINDLKKCGYSKDNCELNFKFLNNLQPEWKQYAAMMRHNKKLMNINIDALYNILKQNQGKVNDDMGLKKKTIVVTSDPLALIVEKTKVSKSKEKVDVLWILKEKDDEKKKDMSKVKCYNCKKKGHFVKDCRKVKVKDYEYYKAKILLAKKHKNEQVLLAEDQAWMESSSDLNQKINANMVFMAKLRKFFQIQRLAQRLPMTRFLRYHITYLNLKANLSMRLQNIMIILLLMIADQEVLYDKMSVQLVELDKHVRDLKNTVLEKDFKNFELEECVRNKDQEIEKCLERLNVCENKLHKMGQTNQSVHIIMPSKDNMYNGRKGIGFENPSYFCKAKDLRPMLYDERVINLGYNPMFFTHSNEALEIKKFKRARENKIEFSYDYGSLNASYQTSLLKPYVPTVILEKIIIDLEDEVVSLLEKEKENLKTIESLKSNDVETGVKSSEKVVSETENKSENDCQVIEKVYDRKENPNVIAPGMFKLSVSQIVSPILMSKTSCASKNIENKTKRKRRKRKSSKQNDKQVNNDVLHANRDFVYFSDLDTFSSVRRLKHSGVIWKKKGLYSTSNVDLSSVSLLKLNKDVKRYSRKDLLSCNNSHPGETSSAYVCNDAMNVSCNSRLCDSFDENSLFIFDDESVRIFPVSKMPFRKKPRDSLNIVQICLWIIDSRCSKHMTGNRALLTNFMEKFLGTVRFENNDFAVIAGYGDVVIGSMTIKKVYNVEGLEHNLFSVGQFCDNGLEVAFQKSTCFVRNEDGVDLLTAKASSLESWLWHQRLSHLNFTTINNLVKNNLVQCLLKMKFKKDHLCSACEQGKIHRKHHKSITAFALNKQLYLLHMDLCGPIRVESINGKRYVLVVVDDYSRYTWVFFLHSKDKASNVIFSFIKKTQVNLQLQVQRVRTDNVTEFKNKTLAKFFDEDVGKSQGKRGYVVFVGYSKESAAFRIYNKRTCKIQKRMNVNFDEISEMASKQFSLEPGLSNLNETGKSPNPSIMKSSTMNVETSNVEIPSHEEEVFHESSESFQEESSSSSLDENIQQSSKEVGVPSSNTQSVSNNMVPNVDEASTSHNVFNERLKDTYFDASTSFHDPSNVHSFYQPYPHEKKWTKDHPLHKIIGDPKSSVRTSGQLANSCLFSRLLISIEPVNLAKALRDADWVSAMQEELDQFARLKVWRLVPRPEGKTIIKTKWIYKNKKDKSSLVIQNKARFVAVGYSQQKGIDYDETCAPVA